MKGTFKNSLFCLIIILTSCQDSSVINVPREYQMPENITVSEKQIAFSVEVNGIAEPLEIVKNQFQCDVFKSNTEPYFVIKTELQNVTGNNSPNCLNSIYFRSDSLCANGEFSSLSGNPADPLLKNAAKIVYVSDSQFEEIIPMELSGNVDNFQVRIFKKGSVFEGEIICSSVLKNGSPLVLRARFSMDPAKE